MIEHLRLRLADGSDAVLIVTDIAPADDGTDGSILQIYGVGQPSTGREYLLPLLHRLVIEDQPVPLALLSDDLLYEALLSEKSAGSELLVISLQPDSAISPEDLHEAFLPAPERTLPDPETEGSTLVESPLFSSYSFTVTQKHQLAQLLRYGSLAGFTPEEMAGCYQPDPSRSEKDARKEYLDALYALVTGKTVFHHLS